MREQNLEDMDVYQTNANAALCGQAAPKKLVASIMVRNTQHECFLQARVPTVPRVNLPPDYVYPKCLRILKSPKRRSSCAIGRMEKKRETTVVYLVSIGIMEKKIETTIVCLSVLPCSSHTEPLRHSHLQASKAHFLLSQNTTFHTCKP